MKKADREKEKKHDLKVVDENEIHADSQSDIQVTDSGSRLGYIIAVHDNYCAASEQIGFM